jgi:hypothetical protein
MSNSYDFHDINQSKANMDDIYNQADPRSYLKELRKIGHTIPDEAKPFFRTLSAIYRVSKNLLFICLTLVVPTESTHRS